MISLKQLAVSLANRQDMALKQAGLLLGSLVELMVEHLKQDDRLRIGGLGVLEVKDRPARMGRDPVTGAAGANPGQQEDRLPGGEGTQGSRLSVDRRGIGPRLSTENLFNEAFRIRWVGYNARFHRR